MRVYGRVWPCKSRGRTASGDRKGVQAFLPLGGTPSLFAHLSGGTLRVPFSLWGAPRPPDPLRKLLKKLEQNFYVLLTFGT
mgnify:CR=1 FL=1